MRIESGSKLQGTYHIKEGRGELQRRLFNRREFLRASSLVGLGVAASVFTPITAPLRQLGSRVAKAASTRKTTITLWGWWEERMKIFADAANDFMKVNPDVEIKVQTFPFEELFKKVYASTRAGTGPTMIKQKVFEYFKMRDQNLLAPYPESMFSDSWLREKYPNYAWKEYGRFVAPEGSMPSVMIYNKAMFSESGLDPNRPPATWAAFFAAAQKLTRRDGASISRVGYVPDDQAPVLDFLYQHGGSLVKRTGGRLTATVDTPEMEKSSQFLVDSVFKYKVWDRKFPDRIQAIGTRTAAITIGESWVVGEYAATYPAVFRELGFAPPPTPLGQPKPFYGRQGPTHMLSVFRSRPEPEVKAAFRFIDYLLKKRLDVQYRLVEIGGFGPVRTELLNSPQVKSSPALSLATKVLPKEYDPVEIPIPLFKLLGDAQDRMLVSKEPVPSVLKWTQGKVQELIESGVVKHLR